MVGYGSEIGHLVVLARKRLGRPGPGLGDGTDGQTSPVQQFSRRLNLDHVPEFNVWAGIRGSPKEVVLKMLKEDSEKVLLLLFIRGLNPPALDILFNLQLELSYANKHRF